VAPRWDERTRINSIRVNGRDVALELRESGSGACTDGCGEPIACRVWVHAGEEYTEPPVAMIVDAIPPAVYAGADVGAEADAEPYELPLNLERFFARKLPAEPPQAPAQAAAAAPLVAGCCSPAEQRSCCDPEHKAECCGATTGRSCGCR
jgi:Domain of unknown function (DUF2703)